MLLPVQITSKDLVLTPALEANIRKKVEKLSRFYNRVNSCRVVIELPKKHQHQGKLYNVRLDVTVPGKEFVANHKQEKDVYIAIREAFNAILRQLEEHARKRHGRVKTHSDVMRGHITRVIPQEGYGFINGMDGNEYYFSMTNIGGLDFATFLVGDAVEFIAETVNDGRQAHRVTRERNNRIAA